MNLDCGTTGHVVDPVPAAQISCRRGTMFSDNLEAALDGIDDLPTLPSVVTDLKQKLDDDMTDALDIARIIESDPSLAAKTLKAVNSAYYGFSTEVSSLPEAVARLGFKQISELCTTLAVIKLFDGGTHQLDHNQFWKHCLTVAFATRLIVRTVGVSDDMTEDEAYVAGLLHDIGTLVLDQFFPEEYAKTREESAKDGTPLADTERRVLGIDHGGIGSRMLRRWDLPESIVVAASCHHRPENAQGEFHKLVQAVRLSEYVCARLGLDDKGENYTPEKEAEVARGIGLSEADATGMFGEMDQGLSRSESLLGLA